MKKVQNIITDKLGIENELEIDRSRLVKQKRYQDRGRPRTVVCRLNRFKDK